MIRTVESCLKELAEFELSKNYKDHKYYGFNFETSWRYLDDNVSIIGAVFKFPKHWQFIYLKKPVKLTDLQYDLIIDKKHEIYFYPGKMPFPEDYEKIIEHKRNEINEAENEFDKYAEKYNRFSKSFSINVLNNYFIKRNDKYTYINLNEKVSITV